MALRLHSYWILLFLCLLVSPLLTGCFLITDRATRLAYDIEGGANKLRDSKQERLEIVHRPWLMPDGINGPYEILLQYSLKNPMEGGTLVAAALGEDGTWAKGEISTTSYHLNFVRVPQELVIRKPKGASTVVVLHKVVNVIEVETLR